MREPDQGPNMSDEKIKEPSGIIAIMTQPDGNVIASAVDFDLSGYGGFKLWEAQRIRAERSVKAKAIRAYCSDMLFNSLEGYTVERMAEDLIQRGKHKVVLLAIGYPDDVAAEIKRRS
jgi:hypothetical protein